MWRLILLAVLAFGGGGCAPLDTSPKEPSRLPPTRLSADAVVLDVAFVKLPAADAALYASIWDAADEQSFPAPLRGELARNGLRVGVYGQQLPAKLRNLLDAPRNRIEEVNEQGIDEIEIGGTRQHLPIRAGHRAKIKASTTYPSLAVLLHEEGQVRGHQLTEATCMLSLKPYPLGDGSVKVSLTPEIEHGQAKTRWATTEGMMVQQTAQDRLALDRLRMEAKLRPGEWIALSTTDEVKGLGACFFGGEGPSAPERRVLLIRLSQTQFDDLFAPEQTSAPLATPGE
jgi:hypothetical protein